MLNFPTELLRSFVAVVEMGGFSQAGNIIGRSQPAMSLQIKRLENLVGAELIRRSNRQIDLTEIGKVVFDYAHKILDLNDELNSYLHQSKLSGMVSLGIPNEFAMSYLPTILAGFTRRYPEIKLNVVSQLSQDLLKAQKEQSLDLVIAFDKGGRAGRSSIWSERLVWVQNQDKEFDRAKALPLVVAPSGCTYRDRMLKALDAAKLEWEIVYTGTSYGGIRAAVMAGLGVTALAKSTVPEGLKEVEHSDRLPRLKRASVSIYYLSKHPDELVSRLAEFIVESVKST